MTIVHKIMLIRKINNDDNIIHSRLEVNFHGPKKDALKYVESFYPGWVMTHVIEM